MNNIFYNVFFEGLNLSAYLLSAGAAILCGVLVAFASTFRSNTTKSFFIFSMH